MTYPEQIEVQERDAQVRALHAAVFGKPPTDRRNGHARAGVDADDGALLERARGAANGDKFGRLYDRGDIGGYPSHSEADLALCDLLAFWTEGDAARVDRLFRGSALFRPEKWDASHYADGRTYGQTTVAKAVARAPRMDANNGRRPDEAADGDGEDIRVPEAGTLAALRPFVTRTLNKRASRRRKETVAAAIGRYLLDNDRLVLDEGGEPYMLCDTGAALPLLDDGALLLAAELARAGLNRTEQPFKWVVAELQTLAVTQGRKVTLARHAAWQGEVLYLSCGVHQVVVCEPGGVLRVARNGVDDVIFAGDAVYPTWEPMEDEISLLALDAFGNINLVAPPEVPEYDRDAQMLLLEAWATYVLANRPAPILAGIGPFACGKTTTTNGIGVLLQGPQGKASTPVHKADDLYALATSQRLAALDNMDDTEIDGALLDAVASVATGAPVKQRRYYTNTDMAYKPTTAALAVTTRTAALFTRPDLRERCLPLFFGEMQADRRRGSDAVEAEIMAVRDGLLSTLARRAVRIRQQMAGAPPGLPGSDHYPTLNQAVWAFAALEGDARRAQRALTAWRRAQQLAIADLDPLTDAVVRYLQVASYLEGTPTEIVATLTAHGAALPYYGGGKTIGRQLREMKRTLGFAGIRLDERPSGNATVFTLENTHRQAAGVGESGANGESAKTSCVMG